MMPNGPGIPASFLRGMSMTGQSPLTGLYNMITGPARALNPMMGLWSPPAMQGAEVAEMYGLMGPQSRREKVAEFLGGALPGGAGGGSAAWRLLPSMMARKVARPEGYKQQLMREYGEMVDELGDIARSYKDMAARSDEVLGSTQALAPRLQARVSPAVEETPDMWRWMPSRVDFSDLLRGP